MTGHPDDGLPIHEQIANAEFRLAFLSNKREQFRQQGRTAKYGMWVTLAIAAVVFPYLALTQTSDPVPALFIMFALLGICGVLMWIYRKEEWTVDVSSELPGYNRYTSYVAFVEEAIKDNEKRLTELKAKS